MYRKRHLSRVTALRASVDVSDVRLERKSRYEYAKLKARGHSRTRTRYASATPVATGSDSLIRSNPLPPTTIGEKRSRAQGDPCHVVRKHPRRMVNPSEEVSHTPMSSLNPGTRVTSPDTGIGLTTTSFQDPLTMELAVPLFVEQRRWWSVYQRRSMRICFSS